MIAFLALFVRLAGQHSWGILCYIIFRQRQKGLNSGSGQHRDPMQSILRNMNVDSTAAWQFMRLRWRLRSGERSLFRRSILYAVIAVIHATLFVAAGVFVSTVTETGKNEVLLRGHTCGVWQDPSAFDLYTSGSQADYIENNLWNSWTYQLTTMAADFSRQCYNTTAADSALANCNAYAPNLLEWTLKDGVACPFDQKMCRNGQAIRLDTGYLDSLLHFGINAKPEDRVKYRRLVECSPITMDGYVSQPLNTSQVTITQTAQLLANLYEQPNTVFQEFNYGPNTSWNLTSTYLWNNYTPNTAVNYGNMEDNKFLIDVEMYMPESPDLSTFAAIEELNRTDADVVLYFLLSAMTYVEPVEDPWFQATTPVTWEANVWIANASSNATMTAYQPDFNASVMGCTQQIQYCNHDKSKCSALTGEALGGSLVDSIREFAVGLDLNTKQQSTLSRLAQASWNGDLYNEVTSTNALMVQRDLAGEVSPALPNNQWILEMQHSFLTGLTSMQMQIASYATGPPDRSSYQYMTTPTAEEQWMCSSQIVQRSGYSTFSLLGVVIVILLGSLIIIVDLTLPFVASKFRRRSDAGDMDEWDEYHHLHTCTGYSKVGSKVHTPLTPDMRSIKTGHTVVASEDWSPEQGFNNNIREPDAIVWNDPYENDFSRDLIPSPKRKRLPHRERMRQVFRKRGDEGSGLMANQDQI